MGLEQEKVQDVDVKITSIIIFISVPIFTFNIIIKMCPHKLVGMERGRAHDVLEFYEDPRFLLFCFLHDCGKSTIRMKKRLKLTLQDRDKIIINNNE